MKRLWLILAATASAFLSIFVLVGRPILALFRRKRDAEREALDAATDLVDRKEADAITDAERRQKEAEARLATERSASLGGAVERGRNRLGLR